jgi:NAD(P)-dependent dehydrogenase (short-subunit alcohol dehydrogenase family)
LEHSIALVTGATSGLGHAAARLLAAEGYREVIVTGRSLARIQETAAQLAAETKTQVFTPLELELDTPSSVQSALAELVKRGRPIDFLLLNAGMVPGKKRVLTAAGIEASQAPLIEHGSCVEITPRMSARPLDNRVEFCRNAMRGRDLEKGPAFRNIPDRALSL